MVESNDVILGHRYMDPVSGWEGIATSLHSYMYGCTRVTLSGVDSDGKPDEFTFDEPQLTLMGPGLLEIPQLAETGGPRGTTHGGV